MKKAYVIAGIVLIILSVVYVNIQKNEALLLLQEESEGLFDREKHE